MIHAKDNLMANLLYLGTVVADCISSLMLLVKEKLMNSSKRDMNLVMICSFQAVNRGTTMARKVDDANGRSTM